MHLAGALMDYFLEESAPLRHMYQCLNGSSINAPPKWRKKFLCLDRDLREVNNRDLWDMYLCMTVANVHYLVYWFFLMTFLQLELDSVDKSNKNLWQIGIKTWYIYLQRLILSESNPSSNFLVVWFLIHASIASA